MDLLDETWVSSVLYNPSLKCSEPESSPYSIFDDETSYLEPGQSFEISKFDIKRELTLITALINDLGQRLITYQNLTDNIFFGALYNVNPEPELLSVKSFCSWKLHPISDRIKDTVPPAAQTVPDLRLIDSDGDVYSPEERMEILDEFEDRDFGRDFQMIAGKEFTFRLAEAGGWSDQRILKFRTEETCFRHSP
jgi:hypothetical protein